MEVDLKRIKADPDEDDGRGGGGGGGDNGEMFEGDDYEGLGQFDDDFDEGAGNSGAGTSGGDGKGRPTTSSYLFRFKDNRTRRYLCVQLSSSVEYIVDDRAELNLNRLSNSSRRERRRA